jgi:RND family efflux transporter MFP subunit
MKKLSIVLFAALALAACKKTKEGKSDLPPAAGDGAKPLPDIPDLSGKTPDPATPKTDGAPAAQTVTGTLQAREQVTVGAKASGTITRLNVDEGSKVKKGDVLFQIDASQAALQRKQAMNMLASAKLQLKTAQREYDRMQGLVAQNAVPQQQLDTLQSQVEGAQLQITSAQNTIAMSNKAIGDATTRAPLSGIVIKKTMSVGEYATMMPPSPVVVIQDQSSLELKFKVPEKQLTSVHQGDPVTVSIASLGVKRAATISEISPMVDPTTRTIELTAILENCDGGLKPGLGAEVVMSAATAVDAVQPECGKAAEKAPSKAAAKAAPVKNAPKAPKKPAAKAPAAAEKGKAP